MGRTTYPFPLAVNSSQHSHYHRFLLGADPSILAPFPKPYCVGGMVAQVRGLAEALNLPRWRKLYHAAIPWIAGFGPEHYALGKVSANSPLPREYGRPSRKFGAFDFVQIADPSVSALALVAGDRRIVERFTALGDEFCAQVEAGACSRTPGPSSSRVTGRMLAGQFAEPNNRWLMPFLHVHARVLNFTSFPDDPGRLDCIDSSALARAGQRAKLNWTARQAEVLSELGYRASVCGSVGPSLKVEGVCPRLVAAIEAPRIAVLRILERALVGDRPPCVERLCEELPPAVIASMAEQLEGADRLGSLSSYKPAKIGIPSEVGRGRNSAREHLSHYCPGSLELLDRTAIRAKAAPIEAAIFTTPLLDCSHRHGPCAESLGCINQLPDDPELGAGPPNPEAERAASRWLIREFDRTLLDVNESIVRAGPDDPLVRLRGMLQVIDNISEAADPGQLRQSDILLGVELERRERDAGDELARGRHPARPDRPALSSLDDLFIDATMPRLVCEQEIGGRSL